MKRRHPALPPEVSRPWLLGAMVIWVCMAMFGTPNQHRLEGGPYEGPVTLRSDVYEGTYSNWAIGSTSHGRMLVDLGEETAGRGDTLTVRGTIEGEPGRAAGHAYAAVLDVGSVDAVTTSRFLPHRVGAWIRDEVDRRLRPYDDGRALLAGFLIGDTGRIRESDVEAMRRSGLAHFVAVSGSNVALFLGLLAVVAGPLALGPRRRAIVGLLGLPIYAAATRFEPSVLRASVMAGLALGGRLIGMVLEAWQLLALAVGVLVVVDPSLTGNVGFQLSVAATSGVLIGARWPARSLVGRALAITIAAQVAVAPLLLVHFGSVPLLSPVVNLVAAPLVTVATIGGAIGVAGVPFAIEPASWVANLVLVLARGASGWPQLGGLQLGFLLLGALLVARYRRIRPAASLAASSLAVVLLVVPASRLEPGHVVVLDVGQGDAILLNGGGGELALIDGGPDATLLLDRLHAYGVSELDLMVLTHPHADHATGLIGLIGHIHIGEVWADTAPHSTEAARSLFARLEDYGIAVTTPRVGQTSTLGALELTVLGPVRRYASPNDQSIVIEAAGRRRMLLAGDIETYAQADLDHVNADVLKVPHQGAATSDPGWLGSVGADLAVISVGPNQFGHPVDWVIETLEASGAVVRRTDLEGDVVVDLS